MYDNTTRSYTLQDAGGNLTWIVENADPKNVRAMSMQDIGQWLDTLIEQAIERDENDLDDQIRRWYDDAENYGYPAPFPRTGYTTTQVFEDEESYRAFKRQEMRDDYADEREMVTAYIQWWAKARGIEDAFDAFMADENAVKDAIDKSTVAGDSGSGYSIELFSDGHYRLLWNAQIGNRYDSPGVIIAIPKLAEDERETGDAPAFYENAIKAFKEAFFEAGLSLREEYKQR